jgi:osmotically-inducible protein OsmY
MVKIKKRILCTALATSVLAGVVACSMTPRKTSEQQQADKETVERVQNALDADSRIYARHISVHADNGVVHLGGYVWNTDDLYEAQRVAETVPGVSEVVDEMELEREGLGNSPVSR